MTNVLHLVSAAILNKRSAMTSPSVDPRCAAAARLGWVVGLAITALSAAGLIFSGVLFTRLSLLVPRAQVCFAKACTSHFRCCYQPDSISLCALPSNCAQLLSSH